MLAERNRLQITSPFILRKLETKIVKEKFASLDKSLLFNEKTLDLNYLKKLHVFLFKDIYYPHQLTIRSEYSDEDLKKVNGMMQNIIFFAEERTLDVCYLKDTMYRLWEYQLFSDGNNRTIWAYLKVFIDYYDLPLVLSPFKENSCGHFNIIPRPHNVPYTKTKK